MGDFTNLVIAYSIMIALIGFWTLGIWKRLIEIHVRIDSLEKSAIVSENEIITDEEQ